MEGYTGSRRAPESTTPAPASAATLPTPDADDAPGALACPNCHASVRADQAWCTLCLTPFRAASPEPEPELAPAPEPVSRPGSVPQPVQVLATAPDGIAPASGTEGQVAVDQAEIDRRADELLAQLAADPTSNPPILPPFLTSKSRRLLAMVVGALGFSLVVVAGLALLGVVFH